NGVNNWLFGQARQLHVHLDAQAIYELLREKTRHCGRVVTDKEIKRQIECSRKVAWTPDHPEAFEHGVDREKTGRLILTHPQTPPWPEPNLEAINAIVSGGFGLVDLWESSPIRLEDSNQAEAIIDLIFPGNPLLCCGLSKEEFATRRRGIWRGHLHRLA